MIRAQGFCAAMAAVGVVLLSSDLVLAQTNVRGWYAKGQVWIVWEVDPIVEPITYDIYASAQLQTDVTQMALIGRLLKQDWEGQRLRNLDAGVTLKLPTPVAGVFYQLLSTEGAFVFTPHAAATRYFAVVKYGQSLVTNSNRDQAIFAYDPVNDPVQAHAQFNGATEGGYPYTAYVVWVDGRPDPDNARPDFPVGGNEHRNGVPHVFVITRPLTPLPPTQYPAVFALHGGEGAYHNFLPGRPERANIDLELTGGVVITPNDNLYLRWEGQTINQSTRWFGYVSTLDPLTDAVRTDPAATDVVVSYTARRIEWILDWVLGPNSGYIVDPARVAMIGHSAGAGGTSSLSRQFPERFCAAVAHCPVFNGLEDVITPNPLHGQPSQNLATNLLDADGQPINIQDVSRTAHMRLSPQRDFCFTHYYTGIRDDNGAAGWTPVQRARFDELNATGMGTPISWDEREHGIEKWDTDSTAPGPCPSWPDIGQWIFPVRTERHSAQYLVATHRNDRSYPGFFNVDEDSLTPGRQPDPGPGDPCQVPPYAAWGTWGGYCEWDTTTIVDQSDIWECTIFLRGLSPMTIDNALVESLTADVSLRRTQQFNPSGATTVTWWLIDESPREVRQSGIVTAGADSLVSVAGLTVYRDPDRSRLIASTGCLADLDGDSDVDGMDLQFAVDCLLQSGGPVAECLWVDRNGDGRADGVDIQPLVNCLAGG